MTETKLPGWAINKIDSKDTYAALVAAGKIGENDLCLIEGDDSGTGIFVVTISGSGTTDDPYVADKTYNEIIEASATKPVVAIRNGMCYYRVKNDATGAVFQHIDPGANNLQVVNVVHINTANSVTLSVGTNIITTNSNRAVPAAFVNVIGKIPVVRQTSEDEAEYQLEDPSELITTVTPSADSEDGDIADAKAVWDLLGDVKSLIDGM